LPPEFVGVVEDDLRRPADSPVSLSAPMASPPFAPRGQLFHFETLGAGGTAWFFTVVFRSSQDDTALHVLGLPWRESIDE